MTYNHTQKRKILTSALFQHSTMLQSFKTSALERIVERIIYFSNKKEKSITEIQLVFKEELGYILPYSSFERAIKGLINTERIKLIEETEDYKLADVTKKEFKNIEINSDNNFTKIINKLFYNAPTSREVFIEPFWFSMNYIFSNIGEFSAKLVEGKIEKEAIFKPILRNCISQIKTNYKIDYTYFEKRLELFFEETREPIYNEFRWILAQNYFITSSLGINPESEIFSKELFENTTLYLDTNVILSLISEKNTYYNNAVSFIEAANKLNIKFSVCNITFEELERWLTTEHERISITRKQIPIKTKSKIGSCIYQDLQNELQKSGQITSEEKVILLNSIVQKYFNYKDVIEKLIPKENLEYVDDVWFDNIENNNIENNNIYEKTLTVIKDKYYDLRNRKKSANAAIHDTKVLLWINKQKEENDGDYRFVTSDFSLPLIKIDKSDKTISILLEAILQWLVPLTNNNNSKEAFSNTLKQRILPKEFLFEINDFMVFEELHMECQELPYEDVENCILYLKQNAKNLNPSDPSDREKIASEVAKYFLDPSRKFKKELSEREKENDSLQKQLGDVFSILEELRVNVRVKDDELTDVKQQHINEIGKINSENDKKNGVFEANLANISDELNILKEEKRIELAEKKFNIWVKPAKYSFLFFLLLLIFGVLELLPNWKWNIPSQLLEEINLIKEVNIAKYRLLISINVFLLTALPVALFAFSYHRLFNKNKRNKEREELGLK
jgi:predicted nucleic acid-binding protein